MPNRLLPIANFCGVRGVKIRIYNLLPRFESSSKALGLKNEASLRVVFADNCTRLLNITRHGRARNSRRLQPPARKFLEVPVVVRCSCLSRARLCLWSATIKRLESFRSNLEAASKFPFYSAAEQRQNFLHYMGCTASRMLAQLSTIAPCAGCLCAERQMVSEPLGNFEASKQSSTEATIARTPRREC